MQTRSVRRADDTKTRPPVRTLSSALLSKLLPENGDRWHQLLGVGLAMVLLACGSDTSKSGTSTASGDVSAATTTAGSGGSAPSGSGQGGATAGSGGASSGQGGAGGSTTYGNVVGTYFVEWSVYGRDYHVSDIPADKVTHILYGFIPICGPNDSLQASNPSGYATLQQQCQGIPDYGVTIFDKFAALEKTYPGDTQQSPYNGNFGQFVKLKQAHPNVKILPSVSGWTLSDPFFSMANSAAHRKTFIDSMVAFLKTYTFFDGIDIDWEYPGGGGASTSLGSAADAANYATLMKELREALDQLGKENSREYLLTTAVGCGPSKIDAVDYANAAPHIDYVFAMSYDFYGAWNNVLGHHTALHPSENNATYPGFNGSTAITSLLAAGVPANKLALGVAMYGRGWSGV